MKWTVNSDCLRATHGFGLLPIGSEESFVDVPLARALALAREGESGEWGFVLFVDVGGVMGIILLYNKMKWG
jgi:hypothetical protein